MKTNVGIIRVQRNVFFEFFKIIIRHFLRLHDASARCKAWLLIELMNGLQMHLDVRIADIRRERVMSPSQKGRTTFEVVGRKAGVNRRNRVLSLYILGRWEPQPQARLELVKRNYTRRAIHDSSISDGSAWTHEYFELEWSNQCSSPLQNNELPSLHPSQSHREVTESIVVAVSVYLALTPSHRSLVVFCTKLG